MSPYFPRRSSVVVVRGSHFIAFSGEAGRDTRELNALLEDKRGLEDDGSSAQGQLPFVSIESNLSESYKPCLSLPSSRPSSPVQSSP